MTDEQLAKIRWLERVKRAEKLAMDCAKIHRRKLENVHSMQKQYKICSSSGRRNIIEMKIADLLDAEKAMNEQFEEVERITEEVHKAIQAIPDTQLALVLDAHYMLFQTYEQIAKTLDISVSTVYRMHKKAIDILEIDRS